jgi:alpha,alpha-trehalose phosphorylase
LVHRTEHSELMMAAAMDHVVDGPPSTQIEAESSPDLARVTVTVTLEPGERICLIKYVTYGWSGERSREAVRDQVDAAMVVARQSGWDGLVAEQRDFLDDFWERADVEIEGDDEIQQAARFALFHVLQTGVRSERRAISAKGLTGTGYDGHAFCDSETFVLSVLSYTEPDAVAHALIWRHSTLSMAQDRAAQFGFKGAAFPWRTITGAECSSYWPAGTAAFHVGADIAGAVIRYAHATSDGEFDHKYGLELLAETARLWCSLGHFNVDGGFCIDGVTGPDEYSAIADNNIYTNLMAQRNLRGAVEMSERHAERAGELAIDEEERASWRSAAERMVIPFDAALGVHPQSERFTDHEVWDFAATTPEQYPLMLNFAYFDLYRKQVVKQADLVLAMYLRGDAFTPEEKRANFDYYERLTVRDSSLSASCQAVMAAEVGYLELAHDYLAEAALMDLDDLEHNTRDGLHIASLAGTWIALVAGLGGMREYQESLNFAPRLPAGITRLSINLVFQGRRLRVETTPQSTSYTLKTGDSLELFHFGKPVTVTQKSPVVFDTAKDPIFTTPLTAPTQPYGRVPRRRGAQIARELQGVMAAATPADRARVPVDFSAYDAWLFDMDGVLTKTAAVHAEAWRQTFDEFLDQESTRTGTTYAPFDPEGDYERYVDGEPRSDGVRNFLAARGITLPEGAASDPPDARTVQGVGNRKNDLVLQVMKTKGVAVYAGAVALITELRQRGTKVAVVSASENTESALKAAGIAELFDARVDGIVVKTLHLAGKPAPDSYLEAAKMFHVDPHRAVVIEDALSGVEAGRSGHFGLVVGVDHHDGPSQHQYADELRVHGADIVITNLDELVAGGRVNENK